MMILPYIFSIRIFDMIGFLHCMDHYYHHFHPHHYYYVEVCHWIYLMLKFFEAIFKGNSVVFSFKFTIKSLFTASALVISVIFKILNDNDEYYPRAIINIL